MSQANEKLKSETKEEKNENENQVENPVLEDSWMIRDCETYEEEYEECTSFKGRFHQYFIYGDTLDCNQWKRDYDNCCKWKDSNNIKAAEALIISEKKRRLERLKAHYSNDTWKRRKTPPANWDHPLPDWMVKRDENTYLAHKAKEFKEDITEENKSFCSVM